MTQLSSTTSSERLLTCIWGIEVEEILRERIIRRRGGPKKKYLVKWLGYAKPTWEPASALEDTVALDKWYLAHPGAI